MVNVSKPEVRCVQGLNLWRNNSLEVNDEIFKGFRKENHEEIINEVAAGYPLLHLSFVSVFYICNF